MSSPLAMIAQINAPDNLIEIIAQKENIEYFDLTNIDKHEVLSKITEPWEDISKFFQDIDAFLKENNLYPDPWTREELEPDRTSRTRWVRYKNGYVALDAAVKDPVTGETLMY
mgnify:CR=1 FL=1